jgi:hypothetical protein
MPLRYDRWNSTGKLLGYIQSDLDDCPFTKYGFIKVYYSVLFKFVIIIYKFGIFIEVNYPPVKIIYR